MRCQWKSFIMLLPQWMQASVDKLGKSSLTELRLRIGMPPQLVLSQKSVWLERNVVQNDIQFCINAASQYSPWSAGTASHGYLTAQGGHRIGLCGTVTIANGVCTGLRAVTSLCIRVARDIPDISGTLGRSDESVLLIGPPGSGKTTLLRDLIRHRSELGVGAVAVLDERCEIFPYDRGVPCFPIGKKTDILSGCPKGEGIVNLIRCMGPAVIAVDEITSEQDCNALIYAGWCGVKLLATAHAGNSEEFYRREVYKPLVKSGIFDALVVLQQDKSWKRERMERWQ